MDHHYLPLCFIADCREGDQTYKHGDSWLCSDGCNSWSVFTILKLFSYGAFLSFQSSLYSFCSDGVVISTLKLCGKDPCQLTQTDRSLIHAHLSPYAQTPVWQDQSLVHAGQPFPGTSTTPRVSSASCSSTEGAEGTGTTLRP